MVSKGPVAILAVVLGATLLGAVSVWLVERELIAQTGMSLALGAAEVAGKLDLGGTAAFLLMLVAFFRAGACIAIGRCNGCPVNNTKAA